MTRRGWWSVLGLCGLLLAGPWRGAEAQGGGLDVQPLYEVASFLLGRRLSGAERRRIARDAARRQAADPAGFAQEMASLRQAMGQIATVRQANPAAAAAVRKQLYNAFYLQAAQVPQEQVPEAIRLVLRKVPVVAADPGSGIVINAWDVDAFFEMDRFVARLAGVRPSFPRSARPLFEQYARQLLASGQPQAAQLAQLSVTWAQVQAAWRQLPEATRQAIRANLRAQVQQAAVQGQLPPAPPRRRGRAMSMEEFGATMSRNYLFNNIFLQNFRAMAGN